MLTFIDADFHRVMVATASRKKILIGRHPVRNWTRRTISCLFCAENYICSQESQQKLLPPELHLLQYAPNRFLAGASPQIQLGELTALRQP